MNWGTLALARLEKGQIYVKYISASVSAWTCFWLTTICTLLLDPGSPYDRFYIRVLNLSCTQKPARVSLSMGSLFLSFIISEQSFGTQSYKLQEYADVFIQLIQHRKTKIINWDGHTLYVFHISHCSLCMTSGCFTFLFNLPASQRRDFATPCAN